MTYKATDDYFSFLHIASIKDAEVKESSRNWEDCSGSQIFTQLVDFLNYASKSRAIDTIFLPSMKYNLIATIKNGTSFKDETVLNDLKNTGVNVISSRYLTGEMIAIDSSKMKVGTVGAGKINHKYIIFYNGI